MAASDEPTLVSHVCHKQFIFRHFPLDFTCFWPSVMKQNVTDYEVRHVIDEIKVLQQELFVLITDRPRR